MHAPALEEQRNRIRVAAYCRVSTDHEDQETSFEAQQTHFTNLISGNPGWELVGFMPTRNPAHGHRRERTLCA
ncbi:MAG: integrase [Lachnospiraceae bacterium]|nr:integrase [Lachnospiraceae bacterium]